MTRTLGLSGFDRDEEQALQALFESAHAEGWRLGPEAAATAVLIDLDSIYGQMAWLKAQGSGRPVAVMTQGGRADADWVLTRPANIESLRALLDAIAAGTPAVVAADDRAAAAAAPAPATTAGEPAAARPATPPPHQPRFLHAYLKPGALPGPVRLLDAEPALLIDPLHDRWIGSSALKPLIPIASGPIEEDRWKALTPAEFSRAEAESGPAQPLSRLRWLAALVGHDGDLAPELARAQRFHLTKYPQSEREFPKHLRIATALLKPPATLDELVAASGASRAEVAGYLNACHAVGILEVDGRG
jgi:hypothetical protein